MKTKALLNYVIVELKKSSSTKQTKSGIYVIESAIEDTTKDGTKVDTTSITIVDVGPKANPELKPGQKVCVNYYDLQILNEIEPGKIYGVIPDDQIKVILEDV